MLVLTIQMKSLKRVQCMYRDILSRLHIEYMEIYLPHPSDVIEWYRARLSLEPVMSTASEHRPSLQLCLGVDYEVWSTSTF